MSQTWLLMLVINCEWVSGADEKYRWVWPSLRQIWWTHICSMYEGLRKGWRSNSVSSFSNPRTPELQNKAVKQRMKGTCMVCPLLNRGQHSKHWLLPFSDCSIYHLRAKRHYPGLSCHCLRKQHRSWHAGRYSTILTDSMQLWINLLSRCHSSTTPISMDTEWPVHLLWPGLRTIPKLRMGGAEGKETPGTGQWNPKAWQEQSHTSWAAEV